jgi:hypothetical protein
MTWVPCFAFFGSVRNYAQRNPTDAEESLAVAANTEPEPVRDEIALVETEEQEVVKPTDVVDGEDESVSNNVDESNADERSVKRKPPLLEGRIVTSDDRRTTNHFDFPRHPRGG